MTRKPTDPAELPPLNEETPPLDAPVAVEWWHSFEDDGTPEFDTLHGFHDAERVGDEAPAVEDGEVVTTAGIDVSTGGGASEPAPGSRYLYMTHSEARSRGISPCVECFPAYATEERLTRERDDGGLLTEPGVEGAVFVLRTRHDLESPWEIDSVHESYTSILYRARAIRHVVGSAAERLRLSYMPIRRCDYGSFEEATGFEPTMEHVAALRAIQPEALPAVRAALGDTVLDSPVAIEHEFSMDGATGPSTVHRADDAPCGYEREGPDDLFEDGESLRDLLETERQSVADVIERGGIVEFCPECFPKLADWPS